MAIKKKKWKISKLRILNSQSKESIKIYLVIPGKEFSVNGKIGVHKKRKTTGWINCDESFQKNCKLKWFTNNAINSETESGNRKLWDGNNFKDENVL
jgi:hypothetical protein